MLGNVLDKLFGCAHKNYSFPITAKKGSAPHCEAERLTGTYVVCLDCGKEFPYDWSSMKVVSAPAAKIPPAKIPPARVASASANTGFVKIA